MGLWPTRANETSAVAAEARTHCRSSGFPPSREWRDSQESRPSPTAAPPAS
jgi:hypothetical protein